MSADDDLRQLPEEGLFGPGAVTWRVHADPSMAVSGVRALLLQALHPLAMAGVAQHSAFREDPWGRLYRTAFFIGAVTYGTGPEAADAVARVRKVHAHVVGTDPFTGRGYRADDSARWPAEAEPSPAVHTTMAGTVRSSWNAS